MATTKNTSVKMYRRTFIKCSLISGTGVLLSGYTYWQPGGKVLKPDRFLGDIKVEKTLTPIPDATWYEASQPGDGFTCQIPKGSLTDALYLTTDMLLDGNHIIVFFLKLHEENNGRTFLFRFAGLNQCSLRMLMPLDLVDQNRWNIAREGAFLKPHCTGDRVNLDKVDRISFTVGLKSPLPARWCMTSLTIVNEKVELITNPVLPKGPLLDELGQSTIHDWPGKTRSVTEMKKRIKIQLKEAPEQNWPDTFSRWGGWNKKRIDQGTGFFRKHFDGHRWWLIDPDGYVFWSTGLNCIFPDTLAYPYLLESALTWMPDENGKYKDMYLKTEHATFINYLTGNFIRTFGPVSFFKNWQTITVSQLKRLRFNTFGGWSSVELASKNQFPYVRFQRYKLSKSKFIFRDFPDVYHPDFNEDALECAQSLSGTVNDPAMIGYFLMNEPSWGFAKEYPAAAMLYNTETCETRKTFSEFLRKKYITDSALSDKWNIPVTFEKISSGKWTDIILTPQAKVDIKEFSTLMVNRFFTILSDACRSVDPNHMNLGIRYYTVPPDWVLEGMKSFDVFSMNCYKKNVPFETTQKVHETLNMPVIIGEWHFGALDVGLPASGIGHLKNQEDRAKAYRCYVEDAAANPYCVGVHWFTLYDESALGRSDGENYNIGFFDVCNRPYPELSNGAIQSHEKMYEVAAGIVNPYNDIPEYLPNLF